MLAHRARVHKSLPAAVRVAVLALCCGVLWGVSIPAVIGQQSGEDQPGGLGPPVDVTDTDVYVNQFLKTIVASGDTHVAASGAWWGPTDRFFDASNGFEQVPQRCCDQVDDGRERGDVAVAARTRPGRLEETVEPFETGVAVG